MIILDLKEKLLIHTEITIKVSQPLTEIHKRYLECLANNSWISISELKKYVYGKNSNNIFDSTVKDNIRMLQDTYKLDIAVANTNKYKLNNIISVGD